jgi:hypothetical protein
MGLLDPIPLLSIMARVTRHLGLGATLSTTFFPPYHLARTLGTLDLMSGGLTGKRLGLLAQLGIPIAGLGGTSERQGSATTTSNPSILSQAQGWAGVLGSLFGRR